MVTDDDGYCSHRGSRRRVPAFGDERGIGGQPAFGQASGVGAVGVVAVEVFVEVALECGHLGHQRAGEGGSPAFLEDRQLQALDTAAGDA